MRNYFLIVFTYVWCIFTCVQTSDVSVSRDTYTDALQNSHKTYYDNSAGDYKYNPPKDTNYLPAAALPPISAYGPPPDSTGGGYDYHPPKDNSYLPPGTAYGHLPVFNSEQPPYYQPVHSIPYNSHITFLDKLKSKISLFTLGKIILKLLIFKKIVKFIGIICLLLVLPKLKSVFADNTSSEYEGMNSKNVESDKEKLERQINEIYEFITKSLEDFENAYT
ncbi:uncharacterized protein LOC133835784 isoform X1 [Drosophila sulfurigaster albostrigata]|uniref:uncharacterized protein LOC133835784 isoform X1 n=1 Tax=Drosophila sulfurigaster albostrigata TaxID=89887 RepID=UPI002D218676|nr:uncharacterized protein LOC133835784 isoform X1 [Drosophila sulfurigaster albostrigata]